MYSQTLTHTWNSESTAGGKYLQALTRRYPPPAHHRGDTDWQTDDGSRQRSSVHHPSNKIHPLPTASDILHSNHQTYKSTEKTLEIHQLYKLPVGIKIQNKTLHKKTTDNMLHKGYSKLSQYY